MLLGAAVSVNPTEVVKAWFLDALTRSSEQLNRGPRSLGAPYSST
jgi:hypothetical protein